MNYIKRLTLINLNVDNLSITEYNLLVTTPKIYNYIPTEVFLFFQTDSMILEKNKHLINEFLEYDYVGAPWNHLPINQTERVGTGGFSLRRKSKMLEILERVPYNGKNEDIFFCFQPNINVHKPPFEKAKLFSVEETFSPVTFACHKPWNRCLDKKFMDLYPETYELYNLNK